MLDFLREVGICFSIQIDRDVNKLSRRFKAKVDVKAYADFMSLRSLETKVDKDIIESSLGLKKIARRKAPIFKVPDKDDRVYSNCFADIMTVKNNERVLSPMRYRLRPADTKQEIPNRYNVFNARLDSLEVRKTWSTLFMRKHGIIPFKRFYEWVQYEGRKKLISFKPDTHEIMWAPCLWDEWHSRDGKLSFKSFAIITDDPPPEILAQGHDRCPIFLKEECIDQWLKPKDRREIYEILKQVEATTFEYQLAG